VATERKDDHLDRRIPESKEEGSFDRDLHRTLNLTVRQINDLEEKVESFSGGGPGGTIDESRVEQLENRVEEFESGVESALKSFRGKLEQIEFEARDEVFTQPVELRAESTEVIGSDGAGRHTVEFEPEELQFRSRPGGTAPLSIRPRRVDLPEKARFEGGGDNRYADVWASGNGNLQIAPKRPDEAVQGPAPADVEIEAREILPKEPYETSLGSEQRKFLSMHVAELWVESLVAQEKIATIGGNVFVGPTTELTKALSGDPSDSDSHPSRDYYNYVRVKHNQMSPGDVVMLDNFTRIEFLRVESDPVQIEAENEEEGGEDNPFDFVRDYNYRYRVERDLDGSGANDWKKGAAVANTGRKKSGFLDLYAERSRRAENESGLPDGRNDSESGSKNSFHPFRPRHVASPTGGDERSPPACPPRSAAYTLTLRPFLPPVHPAMQFLQKLFDDPERPVLHAFALPDHELPTHQVDVFRPKSRRL
jgi:hypothetical protein